MLRTVSALLLACAAATGWAETLAERIAATDHANADQVFELGQWCAANRLPTKARQYYNQAIKLDKHHEGAQAALGRVRVGDRWVTARDADLESAPSSGPTQRRTGGPGPTAQEIAWDLTLPTDPEPAETFITSYIERMARVPNDSRDMDVSVATMLMDEHLAKALPRMCAALLDPGFDDLYGGSSFAMELFKKGDATNAKRLLPFLTKASERVTDPEDLATYAFVAAMLKDKRVVPRLIELLEHTETEVRDAAVDGLAGVTLLAREQITGARAVTWWDRHHDVSDQQTYQEQLASQDDRVALEAAKALYHHRDRAIVPVLIRLLRSDDLMVCTEAIQVIGQITGNTWSYDPASEPGQKQKRADELAKWWKTEQFRFRWIEEIADASAAAAAPVAAATDPAATAVRQLGSVAGNEAASAERRLLAHGMASVPTLIGGLGDANRLVRRKCHDLLVTITKHDLPFDAAASDAVRGQAVAAWTAWAKQQKLLGDEEP